MIHSWVYGGSLAGLLLLGLAPVICHGWNPALILIFLQLPLYMLHQFEEHNEDRFRIFVNSLLGGGRELLTPFYVFVVNVGGVWGVNLISILLSYFISPGYGLIGIYLSLINALVHIAQSVKLRSYNPGLITAIIFLLPAGISGVWVIQSSGLATVEQHALGLTIAIGIHVAIIVHVKNRLRNPALTPV